MNNKGGLGSGDLHRGLESGALAPADAGTDEGSSAASHAQQIERLFREHNEALVSFLALRLRSRQEAREVAQEAYVRLLQLQRQDAASFLKVYLYRVAANLAIDRVRRRMTEARFQSTELFEGLSNRADEPEVLTLSRERLHLVRGYLEELPEPVRTAFLLFRVEEMSQEDIARRLDVTERMVRNYITRALLHCRLRLDGLSREEAATRLKGSA